MNALAQTAKEEALKCYHGFVMGTEPNIDEMVALFPQWSIEEADGYWCAAFVYYCCVKAGYDIPARPMGCSCSLAGCGAWEEWAMADQRLAYHGNTEHFNPEPGDIVLFDRVFIKEEHDHIGIVVDVRQDCIAVAEGNINNLSGILKRPRDERIRAFIRLPAHFSYADP